jgi:adenylate cyclase
MVADTLPTEVPNFEEEGERKEATILFADVRGFTPFCEYQSPDVIFSTLNLYLRAMITPILEESGVLDKIIGDAVMGIFGVVPGSGIPADHAIRSAFRMLDLVREVNRVRMGEGRSPLDIGIGLATGPVVVGFLGTSERRTSTAIGHHVNMAARLESQARPGEILIDETTYKLATDPLKSRFSIFNLNLKGFANSSIAYSSNAAARNLKV